MDRNVYKGEVAQTSNMGADTFGSASLAFLLTTLRTQQRSQWSTYHFGVVLHWVRNRAF